MGEKIDIYSGVYFSEEKNKYKRKGKEDVLRGSDFHISVTTNE